MDASSVPADYDGNMVCDKLDPDDDGDGVNDDVDDFPYDANEYVDSCLLYTSPSPRDNTLSRMPSSA